MVQHARWRLVTVIVLILIAIVYALPNFYAEVPALQISQKSGGVIPASVSDDVDGVMSNQNLPHIPTAAAAKQNPTSIWIHFKNTDDQLKARDFLQTKLPADYTVVASLQATTPHWLQAIGAHPMSLGLDLRGGIHFLLFVDLASMQKERLQGDNRAMAAGLRGQNIRYSGITATPASDDKPAAIAIGFAGASSGSQDAALAYLRKNYADYTFNTVNQSGQQGVTGSLSPVALQNINHYAMEQNMSILTRRVNALGLSEATITQQGRDHISIDLPGVQDPARAKEMIGRTASLRFQLVDTTHDAGIAASSGAAPFGTQLYQSEGRPILVNNQVILRGSNIVSASSGQDQFGKPAVNVRLGSGAADFHRITAANVGKPMAVVYVESVTEVSMVNGKEVTRTKQVPKIISVATISTALPSSFQITGLNSLRYAQDLALQLRSGAYVAPTSIVRNLVVGSTMGKSNIDKGIVSVLVGFIVVVFFMACYYQLFGLVASFALWLNVVFIVAVLSILGATLTLAGIAGIVLTMGMAVDANVLINERIREELRLGMSPLASIDAGYKRAFATIVDANVTTLIVAVILFSLSNTSIKSFAINLIIGLITSMITAIFFTRTFVALLYGKKSVKKLSIGISLENRGT